MFSFEVEDQNNQSLSMTKRWFEALSPQPMDFVLSLCRQPFPETRLAGFQLLQVLATNPWGQEHIVRAPGMIASLSFSTLRHNACCISEGDFVKMCIP